MGRSLAESIVPEPASSLSTLGGLIAAEPTKELTKEALKESRTTTHEISSRDISPMVKPKFTKAFGRSIVLHTHAAVGGPNNPIAALIRMLIVTAENAFNEWQATSPLKKINIVMGSLQIALRSSVPILWEGVSLVAQKTKTMVAKGLSGLFGLLRRSSSPLAAKWSSTFAGAPTYINNAEIELVAALLVAMMRQQAMASVVPAAESMANVMLG